MKITFEFKGTAVTIALDDTAAAKDLISLLPLTLQLEDYARIEKIGYPPRKLDVSSEPGGYAPRSGDLAYYAPWGNIALFHDDFPYASGLVKLGKVTAGLASLVRTGKAEVTMSLAD